MGTSFSSRRRLREKQPVEAHLIPELPDGCDGGMSIEDCVMGCCSGRVMHFEYADTVCPVSEMTPIFKGVTEHSPARLNLGHGYILGPAMEPIGKPQERGSLTISLASTGKCVLYAPSRGQYCILKKTIPLFDMGQASWEIYEMDENLRTWYKRADISYDHAILAFVYKDKGALRWIARGFCSRLQKIRAIYSTEGVTWYHASIGNITIYDAACNTIVAVASGACKGPKTIRIAKNCDVAALLSLAIISCFWWDDRRIGKIHIMGLP
mmetsp:Transcript_11467/g.15664  ORF Transcript_11467/g.15664 Transcript_11467/m.15664 type:complete len:267 (+) Transcript_11467:43-843(+)